MSQAKLSHSHICGKWKPGCLTHTGADSLILIGISQAREKSALDPNRTSL